MPAGVIPREIGKPAGWAVIVQSEAPLTLILSPLRAGRGELERTRLGALVGDPDTVPPKVPLSLSKRERVRVRLDCMDTAEQASLQTRNRKQT